MPLARSFFLSLPYTYKHPSLKYLQNVVACEIIHTQKVGNNFLYHQESNFNRDGSFSRCTFFFNLVMNEMGSHTLEGEDEGGIDKKLHVLSTYYVL